MDRVVDRLVVVLCAIAARTAFVVIHELHRVLIDCIRVGLRLVRVGFDAF
jgi:hypothetical protein